MKSVQTITLDDGSIVLVEMEQIESAAIPDSVAGNSANKNSALGLPSSAVPTSALDKVVDTVKSLQSTLKGAVQIVHAALQDSAPSEWGVELNIGFKGTTRPIPVIVSGEATASLKVHAKWKKSGVKGDS